MSIYLFDIASQKAQWLTARQAIVAGNIANADTPGFRAKDVRPFRELLDRTAVTLARTNPAHVGAPYGLDLGARPDPDARTPKHSGNDVSLEAELVKAGEVNREFRLNTAIVGAFYRMLATSVRADR